VHIRIDFDLQSAAGIARFRAFIHEAATLAVSMGGSISGEHGDGQSKAELLPLMFGPQLMEAFREFKAIWDPAGKMNPGKVVDAWRADENLRLGTTWKPAPVRTEFAYPSDGGDFAHALLRCVGVGECRKKHGLMCPSYMATGEEMHSTRGRARLLFEMLGGAPLVGGWREPAVKEALDLCLSCKGCKRECPVQVDMATYKAEFFAHYYRHRLRPPHAWAFGLIDRWARLASHAPRLANFFTGTPPFAPLARRVAGVAPQRTIPPLAARSFTAAFAQRRPAGGAGRPVLLWPDTFNNYFHPEVAEAALAALEHAGCTVRLPARPLCCGRALYEFGMVERARGYLARVLDTLAADIEAGTPVIGLEPACVSVFRDELPALFPGDARVQRLSRQVVLLSEFLAHDAPRFPFARLARKAVVHLHCHHQSVLGPDAEEAVLARLGLDYELLDAGCCGMAGSFGFARDTCEVSLRCAERVLLPALRAAAPDTLIIADGYSCAEQIRQTLAREPLHLAQVLAMAIEPH
jgi:Fe-S oxidoreductase